MSGGAVKTTLARSMEARAEGKNADVSNFARQVGLYALYDDAFNLVYFGQAGRGAGDRLHKRLKAHTNDHLSERWTRFSWFGILPLGDDGDPIETQVPNVNAERAVVLDQLEAVGLAVFNPPHNLQSGRFGVHATKYFQRRNTQLGPTLEELVQQIAYDE